MCLPITSSIRHGKFENVSGVIEALLILAAAGWIIFEAIKRMIHPGTIEAIGWGSCNADFCHRKLDCI
jgi:divalent metal cation (Fe/Co/Zn/Cd) transporter